VQFCKSSTLGQVASGRSTPARGFSFDVNRPTANPEVKASAKDGQDAWVVADQDGTSLPESESFFFSFHPWKNCTSLDA